MANYNFPVKGAAIIVDNVTIGLSLGGEIGMTFDVTELRGLESVVRQDVSVEAIRCSVRLEHTKFDGATVASIFGTSTAGIDLDGTATAYTKASIKQPYALVQVTVRGTFTDKSGNELQFQANNVIFENLVFPFGEDGFVRRRLEGTADTIDIAYPT